MRRPVRTIMLAALLAVAAAGAGRAAPKDPVAAFLSPRGCVIDRMTEPAAGAAGISPAMLGAFAAKAAAAPDAVRTGETLIVGPSLCVIAFPRIESELSLDDPAAKAAFTGFLEGAAWGEFGCHINISGLTEALQEGRGWSHERAEDAALLLIAAGVRSGELVFYSDDPLRTPPGFALTTGLCGRAPEVVAGRKAHALMMRHLDAYIRHLGRVTSCAGTGLEMDPSFLNRRTEGRYRNVWGGLEVMMMAIASGWHAGGERLADQRQMRPPLCHFEEN